MNKALFFALIALVAAALAGGFLAVGGPGYARLEKADRTRVQDLRRFAEFKTCTLNTSRQPKDCEGLIGSGNPVDPDTGQRFSFERVSDDQFKVCAVFQTDPKAISAYGVGQLSVDGQTGCLTYRRKTPNGDWIRQ